MLLLKLKMTKEKRADEIDSQLVNVLEMIESIEWQSHNIEIMRALEAGNVALKKLNEEMSIDDVESLLADTQEAIEVN